MEISTSTKNGDSSALSASKTECFECNICLDSELNEPVVTLCGHLYCWPCIYQWLHHVQGSDDDGNDCNPKPKCPVCKAEISDALLVPLYGPGLASRGSGPTVPRRPAPLKLGINSGTCDELGNLIPGSYGLRPGIETPLFSYHGAEIGMLGNPSSYPVGGDLSPRSRRREMRSERSLHRVSLFILCCLIMCLLFF